MEDIHKSLFQEVSQQQLGLITDFSSKLTKLKWISDGPKNAVVQKDILIRSVFLKSCLHFVPYVSFIGKETLFCLLEKHF